MSYFRSHPSSNTAVSSQYEGGGEEKRQGRLIWARGSHHVLAVVPLGTPDGVVAIIYPAIIFSCSLSLPDFFHTLLFFLFLFLLHYLRLSPVSWRPDEPWTWTSAATYASVIRGLSDRPSSVTCIATTLTRHWLATPIIWKSSTLIIHLAITCRSLRGQNGHSWCPCADSWFVFSSVLPLMRQTQTDSW